MLQLGRQQKCKGAGRVRILFIGFSSLLDYKPGLTENATRWQHLTCWFGNHLCFMTTVSV